MNERQNFYRWIATCPLTNYRICDADTMSVSYKFQFNSSEPDMDQLYDEVLSDLVLSDLVLSDLQK